MTQWIVKHLSDDGTRVVAAFVNADAASPLPNGGVVFYDYGPGGEGEGCGYDSANDNVRAIYGPNQFAYIFERPGASSAPVDAPQPDSA